MSDGKRAFMMGNALVVGARRADRRHADRRDDRRRRVAVPERRRGVARPRRWPDSSSRTRHRPVPPSATSCGPIERATRARNAAFGRALREAGLGGYRLNWKKAPGRPDIAYPGRKVAIFVHGCYWHHCPRCYPNLPKSNPEFWARKFELNRERDARKRANLEEAGWVVIEAWECDVRDRADAIAARVRNATRPDRGLDPGPVIGRTSLKERTATPFA